MRRRRNMRIRTRLIVFVLTLSALGIAGPNASFRLEKPATLGTNTLKAGDYKIAVNGDQAVIKRKDGMSFTVPVKIEQAEKKFNDTSLGFDASGVLTEIDLGGSKTRIVFPR
jgi:hypothetical protein